jgi:hypothetical protein
MVCRKTSLPSHPVFHDDRENAPHDCRFRRASSLDRRGKECGKYKKSLVRGLKRAARDGDGRKLGELEKRYWATFPPMFRPQRAGTATPWSPPQLYVGLDSKAAQSSWKLSEISHAFLEFRLYSVKPAAKNTYRIGSNIMRIRENTLC